MHWNLKFQVSEADELFLSSGMKDMELYEKQLAEAARKAAAEHMAALYSDMDRMLCEDISRAEKYKENADVKIVQLAALLHDVDDIKLSPDTYVTKKNAVDFMTINKIDGKRIEAVCKIIDEVSFAGTDSVVPDTIEGKCVQDADRLDAIGAIGIARTFAYGGSRGRKIYDPEIKSKMGMNKEEYRNNQDSTSINHFYEKLLLLKDMMNTTEGKKLAEHRQVVMQEFLNEFMLEWEGKM